MSYRQPGCPNQTVIAAVTQSENEQPKLETGSQIAAVVEHSVIVVECDPTQSLKEQRLAVCEQRLRWGKHRRHRLGHSNHPWAAADFAA